MDPDLGANPPIPASASPGTSSSDRSDSILRELQRKRHARKRTCTPSTPIESKLADDELTRELANLASFRLEAARIYAAPMQVVGSALDILYSVYSQEPRKLTPEDMLKATKLLSDSTKAEVFLAMSWNPRVESIRDAWLVEEANVFVPTPLHDFQT